MPEFTDVTIDAKERTAIKLVVEPGHMPNASDAADVTTDVKVRTAIKLDVEPEGSFNTAEVS